ncbi:hypothetical protein E3P99_01408 [Wallemia hederae]|uniref:Spindle assembly checkpoint component MAD1 n=1 Tax=Wallemia hederae TaxID=1540922 RepID=A0A4T0FPZ7_9BASI|nr:hypothetical protein E3P99_01408 [Wallemia hederae]
MSDRDSLKRPHDEQELTRSLKQRTYETSISRSQYERKLLAFETTRREYEITMREKNVQHAKLMKDLAWYKEKAEAEQREKDAALASLSEKKAELDKAQSSYRHSVSDLKEENIQLKQERDSVHSTLIRQLHSKDSTVASLQRRCASLEEDLESATETSNQRQSLLESTRSSLEQLEHDRSSSNIDSSHAYTSFMRDEAAKQSSLNRKLESQNKTLTRELSGLKEKAGKYDVLREEKLALASKVKVLDRISNQLSIAESERDALLNEKQAWQDVLQPGQSPSDVTNVIATLRLENASLKEQVGSSTADRSEHTNELSQLVNEIDNLKRSEKEQQASIDNLTKATTSQNKLLELSQQEVSSLKKQLDTILSEEEVLNGQKYDALFTERIATLEELLQHHKAENEKLSRDILTLSKTTDTSNEKALQLKIQQAEQVAESLKAEAQEEINKLGQEIVELEHKVGRGEFNCKNMRVLEMRDNPVSQDYAIRTETLNALKEENRSLLEKLNSGGSSSAGGAGGFENAQTTHNLMKEKEALEKELSDKDKRMLRLKGIFSDKAVEFREAIYSLLGYRVQFLPNGRVRLNSAFTKAESGGILFQSNEDDQGTMKVEDGSLDGVDDLLRFWVNERESIPCFMANLCLELWDASQRSERGRLAVR